MSLLPFVQATRTSVARPSFHPWLAVAVTMIGAVIVTVTVAAETPAERPLNRRIDAAVEAAAIGPLAPLCDDSDFVRRVYLDLTGMIPTPDQVRGFVTDTDSEKRPKLIDSLLESPDFSRHFAVQLDVLLLDRRTDKYVDQQAWERHLIESIARRKPLDQVFRELIYPDELVDGVSPARKFLLNRTAEPHAMTRDVGRMLFGMDMQCAQCHDHPLIDDYYQADYYGLFAFLNRTSLFEDPSSKLGKLAEAAEGEAPFESVFTGDGRAITRPRLPHGAALYDEPKLPEDEAYRVKPTKTEAAKPTFSRREALAKMLADSGPFRRNVANRVWAIMLGRGLVHPSDFHYQDNPPVNPKLLALLADELVAHQFDLRYLVRQIALSRTYQRSCEPPDPETVNVADIASRQQRLKAELETLQTDTQSLRSLAATTETAWNDAVAVNDQVVAELPGLETKLAEAEQAAEQAVAGEAAAKQKHQQAVARAKPIDDVLVATRTAIESVADDPALTQTVTILEQRADELASQVAAAAQAVDEATAAMTVARQTAETLQSDVVALRSRQIATDELLELETAHLDASADLQETDAIRRLVAAQIELCDALLEYPLLVDNDPDRAVSVWASIIDRWTLQGQVAPLKPLTPEQLAASVMRATGFFARAESAARAAVEKSPPEALSAEGLSDAEKAELTEIAVQSELLNQLRGSVNQFVTQFGGLSGEEFQATVNQALFFGNSPTVNNWLAAAGDSLVGRLKTVEQPAELADELSLAVLSRPATRDEQREVESFLAATDETENVDRSASLAELVWAVITSNEFRFNH